MANKVQPEERVAGAILTGELGVEVEHADRNGEHDLEFVLPPGQVGAVEVTYLTSDEVKVAQDSWVKERERPFHATQINSTWRVTVLRTGARYKNLRRRLEPALAALEAADVREYDPYGIATRLARSMPEVVATFQAERVVNATVMATKDPAIRQIFISPMGGYTARGSDDALQIIEEYLAIRTDNHRKLQASGAAERHIFVWLDHDTPGAIARPFTGGRVEEWDHFGLPSRPPQLPEPIKDLWVVHEGTAIGWRWSSADGWSRLDVSASMRASKEGQPDE